MSINKLNKHTDIVCVYCSSSNVVEGVKMLRNGFSLANCVACSGRFALPRPDKNELAIYYNSLASIRFEKQTEEKSKNDALPIFNKIKRYHPSAKKVLEVGCSTAYYLYGLSKYGFEVLGSELSSEAVGLAEKWYGVKVYADEFPPNDYFNTFDVVVIHHVIEHVPFPVDFFERAKQFLRNGGILLIETPNFDSIGIKFFGAKYPVLCPPGHLNFFRKATVKGLIKGNDELLHLETTSAANYSIYNIIIATISLLSLKSLFKKIFSKRKQKKDEQGNTFQYNTEFIYTKQLLKVSYTFHILLFPLFFLVDILGKGENLNFVIRVNNEN